MEEIPFAILVPMVLVIVLVSVGGWVFTTWLRIKNGYPLENSWGKAIYPQHDNEAKARIQLLTQENAQLRAEIGSIKDRLITIERIVTDTGYTVSNEIERLRSEHGRDARKGTEQ